MAELNWTEEIESCIEELARKQGIVLLKLDERDAALVREAVQRHFINGEPRVWWLGLSQAITEQHDRRSVKLINIIPSNYETCWFIPENERRPVYEVRVDQVESLLDQCQLFEYNLIDRDFNWFLAETDHDMIYICRERKS